MRDPQYVCTGENSAFGGAPRQRRVRRGRARVWCEGDFSTMGSGPIVFAANASGVNTQWFFGGFDTAHRFAGKFHAVRYYNRALSPAELGANLEIDKARFNLK